MSFKQWKTVITFLKKQIEYYVLIILVSSLFKYSHNTLGILLYQLIQTFEHLFKLPFTIMK